MKEHSKSGRKIEANKMQTKSHGPVGRKTKEVLAELVGMKRKLDAKAVSASARRTRVRGGIRPNFDRPTVDLGDQSDT